MKMKHHLFFLSCLFVFCFFSFKVDAQTKDQNTLNLHEYQYQVVACAIFQNETFFLKEWIEYHKIIGVEHFYLYNHLSSDQYLEVLAPYIEEGSVELFDWPVQVSNQSEYLTLLQLPAYNDALNKVKGIAKWAAFIDLDEFIVPLRHNNLNDMLKEYDDFAGLAINWQVFGTSNIEELPLDELITEHFVLKAPSNHPMNQTVKLIVQPEHVESINNPHAFSFFPGGYAVSSGRKPLKPDQMGQPVTLDTVCINHYWFGSRNWYFTNKIPRREKWDIKIATDYTKTFLDSFNQVKDHAIQKFVPQLTLNMGLESKTMAEKPFVTCDLMGQLGNQFFQIATATALALDHGATPLFPGLKTELQFNVPLNYEKVFHHLDTTCTDQPIEYVYIEPQFPYSPIPYHPNMSIRGWFQSEKYFAHHKNEIMALFAPSPEIMSYLHDKYGDLLRLDNTVSIHYRSYKTEDPNQSVYIDCDIDYFERAINLFPEESVFVVFSNDIEGCKVRFSKIARNFVYIEGEAHYHDLYLMSLCKDNIICNSSFSWWGAYLNAHAGKRVVAPLKWFNPVYEAQIKGAHDLIPSDWIVL